MAQTVGINVDRLFTLTFALGARLLRSAAGSRSSFGLTPSFALIYLVFFLIIVSVGGLAV